MSSSKINSWIFKKGELYFRLDVIKKSIKFPYKQEIITKEIREYNYATKCSNIIIDYDEWFKINKENLDKSQEIKEKNKKNVELIEEILGVNTYQNVNEIGWKMKIINVKIQKYENDITVVYKGKEKVLSIEDTLLCLKKYLKTIKKHEKMKEIKEEMIALETPTHPNHQMSKTFIEKVKELDPKKISKTFMDEYMEMQEIIRNETLYKDNIDKTQKYLIVDKQIMEYYEKGEEYMKQLDEEIKNNEKSFNENINYSIHNDNIFIKRPIKKRYESQCFKPFKI